MLHRAQAPHFQRPDVHFDVDADGELRKTGVAGIAELQQDGSAQFWDFVWHVFVCVALALCSLSFSLDAHLCGSVLEAANTASCKTVTANALPWQPTAMLLMVPFVLMFCVVSWIWVASATAVAAIGFAALVIPNTDEVFGGVVLTVITLVAGAALSFIAEGKHRSTLLRELALRRKLRSLITNRTVVLPAQEETQVLAEAVRKSPFMLQVLDAAGVIRYASDSSEKIHGKSPMDVIGQHVLDGVHPEDVDGLRSDFLRIRGQHGAGLITHFRRSLPHTADTYDNDDETEGLTVGQDGTVYRSVEMFIHFLSVRQGGGGASGTSASATYREGCFVGWEIPQNTSRFTFYGGKRSSAGTAAEGAAAPQIRHGSAMGAQGEGGQGLALRDLEYERTVFFLLNHLHTCNALLRAGLAKVRRVASFSLMAMSTASGALSSLQLRTSDAASVYGNKHSSMGLPGDVNSRPGAGAAALDAEEKLKIAAAKIKETQARIDKITSTSRHMDNVLLLSERLAIDLKQCIRFQSPTCQVSVRSCCDGWRRSCSRHSSRPCCAVHLQVVPTPSTNLTNLIWDAAGMVRLMYEKKIEAKVRGNGDVVQY